TSLSHPYHHLIRVTFSVATSSPSLFPHTDRPEILFCGFRYLIPAFLRFFLDPTMASSSSRAYHTSTESTKRGHRSDGSSRARARERAAETNSPPPSTSARRPVTRGSFSSTVIGDKRITERSHVTETTSRRIRTKSPNRDEKA